MADKDPRLEPWRIVQAGRRVRIETGIYGGIEGEVVHKLDDKINGMARYEVTVDYGAGHSATLAEGCTVDLCRYEFKTLRGPR